MERNDGNPGGGGGHGRPGLSREANLTILTISLFLIAIGAYGLFSNKHASLIFSIFAIVGVLFPVLQFFFVFPVLPISGDSRPDLTFSSRGTFGAPLSSRSSVQKAVKIPVFYGLAFVIAGFLSIAEAMIVFAGGTNSDPVVFTNTVIAGVIANCLVAFGLPGFHALQANKGGNLSLIGSALLAAGAIAGILGFWLREDALAEGIGTTPNSYHQLALTTNAVNMLGSLFIAIAILSAAVYPGWTAGVKVLGEFLSFVFIALNGNYGAFMLNVYRFNLLLQGTVALVFGWYMITRQISSTGPARTANERYLGLIDDCKIAVLYLCCALITV